MSERLLYEIRGPSAWLTLNRPEVHNAFDDQLICGLSDILRKLGADNETRAIVLTGNSASFSAGADLNWMRRVVEYSYEQNYEDSLHLANLMREAYDIDRDAIFRNFFTKLRDAP